MPDTGPGRAVETPLPIRKPAGRWELVTQGGVRLRRVDDDATPDIALPVWVQNAIRRALRNERKAGESDYSYRLNRYGGHFYAR
jgi:hypothetical protein